MQAAPSFTRVVAVDSPPSRASESGRGLAERGVADPHGIEARISICSACQVDELPAGRDAEQSTALRQGKAEAQVSGQEIPPYASRPVLSVDDTGAVADDGLVVGGDRGVRRGTG